LDHTRQAGGCEEAKIAESFVQKQHRDLDARISLTWEMHTAVDAEELALLSPWEIVLRAKERTSCVCDGEWIPMTEEMLELQVAAGAAKDVEPEELPHLEKVKAAFRRSLQNGCDKHTNVFIYGPKDAAKTHLLKPLFVIFGTNSFRRPVGAANNYPLMDIFGKKVCLLEDLRAATFKIGFDAHRLWFEGLPVPIPMPQNHYKGSKDYTEKAPILATAGSKLRIPLKEALETSVDPTEQNEMMDSRWTYFRHTHSFRKADKRTGVPPCPHCVAKWLYDDETVAVDFF